jgi:hypothetical protein
LKRVQRQAKRLGCPLFWFFTLSRQSKERPTGVKIVKSGSNLDARAINKYK